MELGRKQKESLFDTPIENILAELGSNPHIVINGDVRIVSDGVTTVTSVVGQGDEWEVVVEDRLGLRTVETSDGDTWESETTLS